MAFHAAREYNLITSTRPRHPKIGKMVSQQTLVQALSKTKYPSGEILRQQMQDMALQIVQVGISQLWRVCKTPSAR